MQIHSPGLTSTDWKEFFNKFTEHSGEAAALRYIKEQFMNFSTQRSLFNKDLSYLLSWNNDNSRIQEHQIIPRALLHVHSTLPLHSTGHYIGITYDEALILLFHLKIPFYKPLNIGVESLLMATLFNAVLPLIENSVVAADPFGIAVVLLLACTIGYPLLYRIASSSAMPEKYRLREIGVDTLIYEGMKLGLLLVTTIYGLQLIGGVAGLSNFSDTVQTLINAAVGGGIVGLVNSVYEAIKGNLTFDRYALYRIVTTFFSHTANITQVLLMSQQVFNKYINHQAGQYLLNTAWTGASLYFLGSWIIPFLYRLFANDFKRRTLLSNESNHRIDFSFSLDSDDSCFSLSCLPAWLDPRRWCGTGEESRRLLTIEHSGPARFQQSSS